MYHLHTPEEWGKIIQAEAKLYMVNTPTEIHKMYMKIVRSLPLFGSSVFGVQVSLFSMQILILQHKTTWDIPSAFELIVNQQGIQFYRSETKEIVRSYSFDDMHKWTYTASTFKIEFGVGPTTEREITLQTAMVCT